MIINKRIILLTMGIFLFAFCANVFAEICATHVYHNHMPNFWPYYDTDSYHTTNVGEPIRYTYDGDVIELKKNPPTDYTYYLPNGTIMPHDDLVAYYSHHAKVGAYLYWPWRTTENMNYGHPYAQKHVTMSGAVVNNVNNIIYHQNVEGYDNPDWNGPWKNTYNNVKTVNNYRALDLIHFTGHHTMGPLVGRDYMLKDLIFHNVTLAQNYFLGSDFKSSKGFFPTELGFSERIIPTLKKLGIEWTVLGNVHYSRTLVDYPYLNDPGVDCLISPPNRADLQNRSDIGSWVARQMYNEQQVTHNKFPFASTPHYVKYVDPETGEEMKIVGIPVEQAASWEEGYQGSVTADFLKDFESLTDPAHPQFFVIAHDGDNSSGRAGDEGTWNNAAYVTYQNGVIGMGVDEYLHQYPLDLDDVVHVQDGSWIDTRDSSSDPQWHHWHLPMGIWKGQFYDFNRVNGTDYAPKKNLDGIEEGMTVSFEYGYHYLERNFALLQAALNYAKTAEQIWLDTHPDYWQPTTDLEKEITYPGNQLNPWMYSYPVKGDPANDYQGGANPAELAWYFLLPAMDSGFGYYDENQDDCVKPTLAFNNSLYFSKPYVNERISQDRTGPSIWWPQRWPYNPGSVNCDKSEGWTTHYFDNTFAIYTYGYDVSGIQDIKVKIRVHNNISWQTRDQAWIDASDNTFRVYNPFELEALGVPNIDSSKVSDWVEYPMEVRDLSKDINGVDWQPSTKEVFQKVPAQEIGNLYYAYIKDYRDQMIDYYIEAVDARGNVTRTDIQTVYVGSGTYRRTAEGKIIEDPDGDIVGTYPFITDQPPVVDTEAPSAPTNLNSTYISASSVTLSWNAATDNVRVTGYEIYRDGVKISTTAETTFKDTNLTPGTDYSYKVKAYDGAGNVSVASNSITVTTNTGGNSAIIYYKKGYQTPYIHYCPEGGSWTTPPGVLMEDSEIAGYSKITLFVDLATTIEAVFTDGNGNWDNNGGQNYIFPIGTSTFDNGQIIEGAPTVDTESPTTPANIQIDSKTATTVSISWSEATDNVGVSGYEIYRDGIKIGNTANLNYMDQGLTPSTSYSYKVRAVDGAGNLSGFSNQVNVTTDSGNFAIIYYKRGYQTPYIHYCPTGGNWTTPPGLLMNDSEIAGYSKIYLELGSATGVEAVFTDGYGNWDNNGGMNYNFLDGISTFDNGQIIPGAPIVDEEAPSAPADLISTGQTMTTISLKWTESTDNVGVVGYEIYRNGEKVATTTAVEYTDINLAPGTSYSYIIKAYDAVGNLSQASNTVTTATTHNGNIAIIYYKHGFTEPYIHYCPEGSNWTNPPGVRMEASEITGYSRIELFVDTATYVEAVFTDGYGNWDNNWGQNYIFPIGTSTFENGQITEGAPVVDQEAPSVPTNLCINSTSATSISLVWTAATDNVGVQGYKVYRNGVEVGTTVNTNYTDTGLNPDTDYSYTVKAFDNAGNTSTDSNTVIGSTDNGNIVTIYYKHGYTNPYIHYSPLGGSWTTPPGVLMDESEYANYSKITIEIGSASGIEAVFTDGNGNWDNNWGQNYIFPSRTSTFENGQIFEGTPQ